MCDVCERPDFAGNHFYVDSRGYVEIPFQAKSFDDHVFKFIFKEIQTKKLETSDILINW